MAMAAATREEGRFLDMLNSVGSDDDEDEDQLGDLPSLTCSQPLGRQESAHGPMHWNTRRSEALQEVVDSLCIDEVCKLGFSVTVADPSQPDCPLVACSTGFTELTGYSVHEIVGRNCRFLLNGVPSFLIDEETRIRCRSFCVTSAQGGVYDGESENLPEGVKSSWIPLPQGEMICVQTNARKSGELFRNMFYLKQVELDDTSYILGLQAGLPEDFEVEASRGDLERACTAAFGRLEENMSALEQVLAQQFWYSAPMRRQL